MTKPTIDRPRTPLTPALILISALVLIALAPTAEGQTATSARTARTLTATDTAHLHHIGSSSAQSLLYEEGTATGTIPGSMRARVKIASTVTASFTIYTHGGTITGHGTATPHASGRYESFAGSLTINGGTGRYAHAHGHGRLYGVYDRISYALTIQTTGRLSY